ncbi:hypothetical protein MAR_026261 [Mya arenaria]|uniref:Deoxynucleoside kinase domain-containing protein n=1 Tax=Mya arenaria TaxID=6604 RepID=A0ABY7ETQ8_MYAAR|nr:hypothetical protein MAR_026261 [Mya arenaria]
MLFPKRCLSFLINTAGTCSREFNICFWPYSILRRKTVRQEVMKHNFTVCVEGNIASGKTRLLEYFRKFSGIVEKYLEDLHQLHEKWLVEKTPFKPTAPVLIVFCSLKQTVIYIFMDVFYDVVLLCFQKRRNIVLCVTK